MTWDAAGYDERFGFVAAYGAGLLSSGGELGFSVQSDKPARRPLDTTPAGKAVL